MQHDDLRSKIFGAGLLVLLFCCSQKDNHLTMQEVQLTKGLYGHMLNGNQVFSPDDEWIVYDTRNDQTHISRTCCIEKVNTRTGEVVKLYSAPHQSLHGPGVGAASWHPTENKVIFIHGLLNCDEKNPYGFTRRFGAVLKEGDEGKITAAEARTIDDPLLPGALRGGTHAHSWSGDGAWISFTYNDFLIERLEQTSNGKIKDLRTIGVMAPSKRVKVETENAENFSGEYFSVVAATVVENAAPGSDEIEKAFDECWVGDSGYVKADGTRQNRAVAFQGHIRTRDGSLVTEIFVADIPDSITNASGEPLEGTMSSRPAVPAGLAQRRLTFTSDRKFPGLQGPRFWLRSSPDGSLIYFLMKDYAGIVQVYEVPVLGGDIRQVTKLSMPVQAQFNISPDGKRIALIADNSIWISDIKTGKSDRVTSKTPDATAPQLAVMWNNQGNSLVYNRYVENDGDYWLQIFKLDVN